jgi:DNA-binding NtrC family response regulator
MSRRLYFPQQKLYTRAMRLVELDKSSFRILGVDDELSIRELLENALKSSGYSDVEVVDSGEAALEKLAREHYDLVLLDINMPGISGLKALKEIKEKYPKCQVIMITAYGSMESAMEAIDLGAFSYVTKPFGDIQSIYDRVESALEKVAIVRYNIEMISRLQLIIHKLKLIQGEPEQELRQGHSNEAIERLVEIVTELEQFRISLGDGYA